MIHPEQIVGGKYVVQAPYENNCLIYALANAFIHDGALKTEEAENFIEKLTKKFDVDNEGSQITTIGETIYNFGYDQSLSLTPGDIHSNEEMSKKGWLGIRTYTTDFNGGHESNSRRFLVDPSDYDRGTKWIDSYMKKYPPTKPRKLIQRKGYGCHAAFYFNYCVKKDYYCGIMPTREITADFVNIDGGISKCKWMKMGVPREEEKIENWKVAGSQLCLFLRKKNRTCNV